ncbi:MAG TPA: MFS transporter [Sphingomicrobium sp.]|nr:MFS transporter [Sphingomicrobium sp.]
MAGAATTQGHKPWGMARVITASSAGTAFEWYDFFIFGSLALTIQKVFFAGLNPTAGLIAALGLFAAGFAFRPLGAIIFGVIGDRLGRKGAFLATVTLMGAATFLIGLLPTYETAGIISPVLLILLRILQGIALGGEYGGAAIYVAEHSPDDRRGFTTGWIQITASVGLIAGLLVILATRSAVGEAAFLDWGWRVPFLISVVLLAISVWLRFKLSESPAFIKLKEEGQVAAAPFRESFGRRDNLKRVLVAFFGIMCAQGAVWYLSFFYVQVFLTKSLGVPEPTKDALVLGVTALSAPLYVLFGWLSDRVGRKPVMLGGMLLALVAYYPGFHAIAAAANPALVEAQQSRPVVVFTDPATCSVQFDPVGTRQFKTACDIARSLLASTGISYDSHPSANGRTVIVVGAQRLEVADGSGLAAPELKALKSATGEKVAAALTAEGYPQAADPEQMNLPVIFFWLMVFAVAATALYGPQAAALVEMFPTRIRYTAMSVPYHIGTGWIGGFLPVTSFALVAITGDIYASLWYPAVFTIIPIVVSFFFLKETRGKPLGEV